MQLDAGSTARALTHELWEFNPLWVLMPCINSLQELADPEAPTWLFVDRLWRVSQSTAPLAEAALEPMSFDRVFLSPEDGTCEAGHSGTPPWNSWRDPADMYVPANASTLGLGPFQVWARLALPWMLVMDDRVNPSQVQNYPKGGIRG